MAVGFLIGVLLIAAVYILFIKRSAGAVGILVVAGAALVLFAGGGGPVDEGASLVSDVSGFVTRLGDSVR